MCSIFDTSTRRPPLRIVESGVLALDADQRCLMRGLELLRGIDDGDEAEALIAPVLDMICLYSSFHFRRQERIMAAVGFPGAHVHQEEHAAFLAWLETCRSTCGLRTDPDAARRLCDDITGWFHHHMLLQDLALYPYLVDVEAAERIARDGASVCLVAVERPARANRHRDFGPYAASALAM